MGGVMACVGIAVFLVGAIAWRIRDRGRADLRSRDDTLRVGAPRQSSSADAVRRAEGTTAWARLSGP